MASDMLTVPEASAVTHVPVAKVNAMIDDGSLPLRVIVRKKGAGASNRRFLRPEACGMIKYHASTGALLDRQLNRKVNERFKEWKMVWRERDHSKWSPSLFVVHLSDELRVDLTKAVHETVERLRALDRARELVVQDPDLRGGLPVLKGTRLGVYEVAALIKDTSIEEALATYPTLTPDLATVAVLYAEAYPKKGRPRKAIPVAEEGRTLFSRRSIPVSDLGQA